VKRLPGKKSARTLGTSSRVSAQNPGRRRILRIATSLWLIVLVALGLRLGFAWRNETHFTHWVLSSVPFLYEPGNIAYSLAIGHGFSSPFHMSTGPTAWEAPIYPLLVAGIFRFFGVYTFPSYVTTILLNILFSTLACIPVFFAGKRICGLGVAAGGAWLWAVFPNAIIIPYEWVWDTSLSTLLAASILWATLGLEENHRARNWIWYGLLWGFALMTNPTLLSGLPFFLGWLAYRAHKRGDDWIRRPAMAMGMIVLCCAPWTIRNYAVFHRFVPLRSVLGLQLWLGNNDAYRTYFPGYLHPIDDTAERNEYIRMGEIDYMRGKLHEALDWMMAHPGRVAKLSVRRFVGIWTGSLTPLQDFETHRSFLLRFLFLSNFLAGIGALGGVVILWVRRNRYAFPAAVLPVVFPFAFYLTQALLRYRHPIDPIVMLLAAVTLAELFHARQRPPAAAIPSNAAPGS
jgi:hypothetical protein